MKRHRKPYSASDNRCDRCNRVVFLNERKATWANTYDFVAMEPKDELLRSNARPWDGDMRPYQGSVA